MTHLSAPAPAAAGTQAMERGLRLIELVATGPVTVREASEQIELPRTTVARLLGALERHSYVTRTEAGTYVLGAHVLSLAACWHSQTGLAEVAQPQLERLAHHVRETGHIMIREGRHVVCVAYAESPAPIRLTIRLGMQLPLNAGAHAKVLFAFAPGSVVDDVLSGELQALTSRTPINPESLRRELMRIRRVGYAESVSEVDYGANALAVPIRAAGGQVVASIGVSWPERRMGSATSAEIRDATLDGAAVISASLGYREDVTQ